MRVGLLVEVEGRKTEKLLKEITELLNDSGYKSMVTWTPEYDLEPITKRVSKLCEEIKKI